MKHNGGGIIVPLKVKARELVGIVLEAVGEGGHGGAPEGILFAEFGAAGMDVEHFRALMATLVNNGLVAKQGDRYFVTPAGKEYRP